MRDEITIAEQRLRDVKSGESNSHTVEEAREMLRKTCSDRLKRSIQAVEDGRTFERELIEEQHER